MERCRLESLGRFVFVAVTANLFFRFLPFTTLRSEYALAAIRFFQFIAITVFASRYLSLTHVPGYIVLLLPANISVVTICTESCLSAVRLDTLGVWYFRLIKMVI